MNAKAKVTRTSIAASGYSNPQAHSGKPDAGRWSGEGGVMKIGNRVSRKDAPGIVGTVIARDGERLKVYWSSHTTRWADRTALTLAPRLT